MPCPSGSVCGGAGISTPTVCPLGAHCAGVGLSAYASVPCVAGSYCPVVVQNASNGVLCTMGSAGCSGSTVSASVPCPTGTQLGCTRM
jgi:hypothetical protein